jgi:hypothetical protein
MRKHFQDRTRDLQNPIPEKHKKTPEKKILRIGPQTIARKLLKDRTTIHSQETSESNNRQQKEYVTIKLKNTRKPPKPLLKIFRSKEPTV